MQPGATAIRAHSARLCQPWREVPRADPSERRPWAWDVAEARRIAARRWRERAKARRADRSAGAEHDDAERVSRGG